MYGLSTSAMYILLRLCVIKHGKRAQPIPYSIKIPPDPIFKVLIGATVTLGD